MATIFRLIAVLIVLVVETRASWNISALNHEYRHDVIPEKSANDRVFIETLSSRLLEYKKPLNMSAVPGVSDECQRDFHRYLDALQTFELWALKMYDASSQLSFGILSGNVNMYGDFEECLSVTAQNGRGFQGRHCYAELQPTVEESAVYLQYLRRLAQSYDVMRSTFDDTGHIFGRFSSIIFGVCIPSTCSHQDVERAMRHFITEITTDTGLMFDVQVDAHMCHINNANHRWQGFERGEIITIGIFALFGALSLASSLYDDKYGDHKNPWLTSFSVYQNWRELTTTKRSSDDIHVVHGIRFLNAILIFLCHKTVESMLPKNNRTALAINAARPSSIVIRMCALYTDVFLMLSGLLVAYTLAKKLKSGQKINATREFIGRYIRVMPSMVTTMLVTAYIIPNFVGQTPHRANVIEKPAELCKLYGWRNLLLIHNWFNFEEMCNLHTHHVGSDFELFLIAPLLMTILWKWPRRGTTLVIVLAAASTVARFYVTYTEELMYFVPFGARLVKLLATANNLYSLPTYRFTVYGIGLLLGFVLRKYSVKLSKRQYHIGQIVNGALIVTVIAAGVTMTGVDVKYDVMTHSLYAAFAPILYCLHVAWIIFAAHQGHKSSLVRLLEWKGFAVTTKFCYAFYLIQIPIFQTSIANTKDIPYYHVTSMINLNEIFVICVASVLMTLFIETPFNNIKRLLYKQPKAEDVDQSITMKEAKTD